MASLTPVLLKSVSCKFSITGIVFLSSGHILLSNWTRYALELWDRTLSCVLSSLPFADYPHGIRMKSDTEGAVAVPGTGLVLFKLEYDQLTKISTLRTLINVDFVYHQSKYLVGWSDKILVLDNKQNNKYDVALESKIGNMAVRDKNTLCYSVHRGNALHCITVDGQHVFTYTHDKLENVKGITVDQTGCIYVCGHDSRNVHQLSHDGKLKRIIFDDLPAKPRCISFNELRNEVIIGCDWRILLYDLN